MPVIGCCNSPPNLVVITQFVPIGSLYQVLHEDGGGGGGGGSVVVDTPRALQFASDIAKGMAFLHSLDRQMPRFHLNSKHVMVSLIRSRAGVDFTPCYVKKVWARCKKLIATFSRSILTSDM